VSSVPKRIWVLLAVSLAVNLFCLGLVAGGRFRPRPEHREESDPRAFMRHSGLREAGPEVKQILKQRREHMKGRMRELGRARDRVRVALEAEPYDAAAVTRAFGDTRELTTQMQTDMHSALTDVAGKLTPEQRKRMAESLWSHRGKHALP
jgi:uncharacterized membrane protein